MDSLCTFYKEIWHWFILVLPISGATKISNYQHKIHQSPVSESLVDQLPTVFISKIENRW